jgi:asparagine synthetase B (glutamine-hydrolysing)
MSVADSGFGLKKFRRYIPLMSERFPDYYYSRTSNPHLTTGNGLGTVYSAEFQSAIDRESSVAPLRTLQARMRGKDTLHTMLYIDTKTWLPDDLLIKADKMTMANSIELRVPLLDHKVLEFAASLPPRQKINGRDTKYILKRALSQRIPDQIRNRKKAGFPVPYASWIRRELKGLVRDVLLDSKTCGGEAARGELQRRGLLEGDFLSAHSGTVAANLHRRRTRCSLSGSARSRFGQGQAFPGEFRGAFRWPICSARSTRCDAWSSTILPPSQRPSRLESESQFRRVPWRALCNS